jgi:segregation and condensation protein B
MSELESEQPETPSPEGQVPDGAEESVDLDIAGSAERPAGIVEEAAPEDNAFVPEQMGLLDRPEAGDSETARVKAILEAIVYVTDEPLSAAQIAQGLSLPKERIELLLAEMAAEYGQSHRGLTIREVAGGYKMSTKPEVHDEIRSFVKKLRPPLKLSLPALETLAVIAYKQPVTAPEIMEIRGVQGAGVLKTLLERKLIVTAGRKPVVGKPVLYKTTKDFLVQFGLKDLTELPTLKEFEEWSRLALADSAEDELPAETATERIAEQASAAASKEDASSPDGATAQAGEAGVPGINSNAEEIAAAGEAPTPATSAVETPERANADGHDIESAADESPAEARPGDASPETEA